MRTVIADGGVDLRGPAVFGKRGERFLYLTWGDVGTGDSFAMFRRAKLMIGDIEPELLAAAARDGGVLFASLSLTDERGCPRCAPRQATGDQLAVRLNARGSRRGLAGACAPRIRISRGTISADDGCGDGIGSLLSVFVG